MWLVNWIINSIPLWAWVTIVGAVLLATYSLWLPIWNLLPGKVKVAIIFVATLGGAYLAGRYKGARDERDLVAKRNAEAIQKRLEVNREVDKLSNKEVDDKLKPWIRPDD